MQEARPQFRAGPTFIAVHPHLTKLLKALDLEEQEERRRFRLDETHSLQALKAEGLALHPLRITHRGFGYADYPELSFRLPYPADVSAFRDGASVELVCSGETPVPALLLSLSEGKGELRLFAPDFPDWLDEPGVALKCAPDVRTLQAMRQALQNMTAQREAFRLFEAITGEGLRDEDLPPATEPEWRNHNLNRSQQAAVREVLRGPSLSIVHGPPGTGKTTTVVEIIVQAVRRGQRVMASAPSHAAVDHLTRALLAAGVPVLRIGRSVKVAEDIQPHTPEGRLQDKNLRKELKDLRIRAEEFRRMALQYKRRFGPAEREQRNLLFREVKQIRQQMRDLLSYHEEKLFADAAVVLGTPMAHLDQGTAGKPYDLLVLDEAGQCLQPLGWALFPMAPCRVLAGDPFQLPPTVLSAEAQKAGLGVSILEQCYGKTPAFFLLDTQYRMRRSLAGFSSERFYGGALQTPAHLNDEGLHFIFYDTAGTGFEEEPGPDGSSLHNPGELRAVVEILHQSGEPAAHFAFISPYSAQVYSAKEKLPPGLRISTIDSFQGQEHRAVIVSLVRSNEEGQIGFLQDTRRMNVALTRAKEQLIVIGDSTTLASHPFYAALIDYVQAKGEYRSVWELGIEV